MTAGVAGFTGVKCSRPSVADTQEHQHTHTHKQMHREEKERQKTGCEQQDQNKTEMAGRLEDCDRYSPQAHTYMPRSGDFADVLGIFFFYFYFCHKRKKERKDVTPHTVYTEVNTRCQEKGGY